MYTQLNQLSMLEACLIRDLIMAQMALQAIYLIKSYKRLAITDDSLYHKQLH